jgi:hypothetical protein
VQSKKGNSLYTVKTYGERSTVITSQKYISIHDCKTDHTHSIFGLNTYGENCKQWVMDSGASDHMTFSPTDLVNNTEPEGKL